MRLIIQRVLEAGVKVNGEFISKIGPGICILLGLHKGDNAELVDKWAEKALKIKLWPEMETITEEQKQSNSPKGKGGWKTGVQDNNYEVLVVSNFTLYGILKGNKPDFHDSMNADEARDLYNRFMEKMQQHYSKEKIQGGQFQTYMNVHIVNDGPVTLCIDADEAVNMKQNQQKQKESSSNQKANNQSNNEGEKKENQGKKQKNNNNQNNHEQKNKQQEGEEHNQKPQGENKQKTQGENKQKNQGEHKQKHQGENKQKQQGEQKQKTQQHDQKEKPQAEQKQKSNQNEQAQKKQKPVYEEKIEPSSEQVEQQETQTQQEQQEQLEQKQQE